MLLWRLPCPGLPSAAPQSCPAATALALQVLIAETVSLQLSSCQSTLILSQTELFSFLVHIPSYSSKINYTEFNEIEESSRFIISASIHLLPFFLLIIHFLVCFDIFLPY